MMTDGDRLRSILSARDGETVYEAAERVVRERDEATGRRASGFALRGWIQAFRMETPGANPSPPMVRVEILAGADPETMDALERYFLESGFFDVTVSREYDDRTFPPTPGARTLTALRAGPGPTYVFDFENS